MILIKEVPPLFKKCINTMFLWLTKPFHFLRNYPVLYHGKHINIVNFGVFAALDGMAILLVYLWYMYTHMGELSQQFFRLTFLIPIFVWSGAKLYYFGALGKKFIDNPRKYIVQTGFYVQGGIIGAVLWGIIASNTMQISFFILADALCLGTFLGQFFGRLGCFNYGCCYGKETHAACGLNYHNHESKVLRVHPELDGITLHPTQLYESIMNLTMFILMLALSLNSSRLGLITIVFFIYQGLVRIFLELFRGDIYFNNQRNWITFYASITSIVAGVLLFLMGPTLDAQFFISSMNLFKMNAETLVDVVASYPIIIAILVISGIFLFVGYGFHGKRIGYFPNILKELTGHKEGKLHEN